MTKIVFLFPGQGSQAVGMGKAFYDAYPLVRETFQEADECLGRHLSKIVFEGPEEVLKQTANSQPALFVTSLAILRVLQQQFPAIRPLLCAGHSLGEYSAICAGGWLSFSAALELVQFRAEAMGRVCKEKPGAMAAILGLEEAAIQEVVGLAGPDLWAANFNCPGQVVISGSVKAVERGMEIAKQQGAKRALLLPVQGAFHSGLMIKAEEQVAQRLMSTPFATQGTPIVSNATAKIASTGEEIKKGLAHQITQPVLWTQSMREIESKTSLFIEIGQGKVLTGLNKKICSAIPGLSVAVPSELEQLSQVKS